MKKSLIVTLSNPSTNVSNPPNPNIVSNNENKRETVVGYHNYEGIEELIEKSKNRLMTINILAKLEGGE